MDDKIVADGKGEVYGVDFVRESGTENDCILIRIGFDDVPRLWNWIVDMDSARYLRGQLCSILDEFDDADPT